MLMAAKFRSLPDIGTIIVTPGAIDCITARQQAVAILVDNGVRGLVAASFGVLFANNCFQNGLLPIGLPAREGEVRQRLLQAAPGSRVTVDLEAQTASGPDEIADRLEIDGFRNVCRLHDVDDISRPLSHASEIAGFEARKGREWDWL